MKKESSNLKAKINKEANLEAKEIRKQQPESRFSGEKKKAQKKGGGNAARMLTYADVC
jgi:hypothetical protein